MRRPLEKLPSPKSKANPEESAEWEEQALGNQHLCPARYPAGIISQPREEIETTDIKKRKAFTTYRRFHTKSRPTNSECRITIQDVRTTTTIHQYIRKMARNDHVLGDTSGSRNPREKSNKNSKDHKYQLADHTWKAIMKWMAQYAGTPLPSKAWKC